MAVQEIDVRPLRGPDRNPTTFRAYDALGVGESFVLVDDHDPLRLRDEFDVEHPGSHHWDYVERGPETWRVRIGKAATTPLPHVVGDWSEPSRPEATEVLWKLRSRERDLDSNVIWLPPGAGIEAHAGPELDSLVVVLQGGGSLTTELDTVDLRPGGLVWLPRRSRRAFRAGDDGLRYLTVHQRREALVLRAASPRVRTP